MAPVCGTCVMDTVSSSGGAFVTDGPQEGGLQVDAGVRESRRGLRGESANNAGKVGREVAQSFPFTGRCKRVKCYTIKSSLYRVRSA